MKRKSIILIFLFILVLVALVISNKYFSAPVDEIPMPLVQNKIITFPITARPAKLLIPKINVASVVQEVGITESGNMGVPEGYTDVGWYKFGTMPGNTGSAVIAGHVNNRFSLPAVFYDLKDLENGDDIFITTEAGDELHFKVVEKKVYGFNQNVPEVFTDQSGRILNLITCTGTWDKQYKTHDQRLVVRAELVE